MLVAIVGKRNAGKSTLVNSIAQLYEGQGDRVIVSEIPGTTRDSVDVRFEKEGKTLVVIDTAGVRKKRHMVTNDIAFYSFHRAQRSIRRADVVLMLVDAIEPVSEPDKKLAQYIAEQLKRWAVAPRRLLVELTETSAVSDLHDAQRFIEALRHTGCIVCLDDFGTGFSSFAYLKHLQADSVKIDGLFIRNLPQEHDNQLFVKAIVSVAKGLQKTTIAECVEDDRTYAMLKEFGVDFVQGYYLGKPREEPATLAPLKISTVEITVGAVREET